MPFLDDLIKASEFYSQSASELEQSRTLNDASRRIKQLQEDMEAGAINEKEMRQEQRALSQEVARRLQATGAPVSQQQQAFANIGPSQARSGIENLAEAFASNSEEGRLLAEEQLKAEKAGALFMQKDSQKAQKARDKSDQMFKIAMQKLKLQAESSKKGKGTKKSFASGQEFSSRYSNIKTNLRTLRKMIEIDGTYEMFGGHNKKINTLITSVATDAAKLFDPESVARESEVENIKNMLGIEGGELILRNDTALEVIDFFNTTMDERAQTEIDIKSGEDISPFIKAIADKHKSLDIRHKEMPLFQEIDRRYKDSPEISAAIYEAIDLLGNPKYAKEAERRLREHLGDDKTDKLMRLQGNVR